MGKGPAPSATIKSSAGRVMDECVSGLHSMHTQDPHSLHVVHQPHFVSGLHFLRTHNVSDLHFLHTQDVSGLHFLRTHDMSGMHFLHTHDPYSFHVVIQPHFQLNNLQMHIYYY